MSPRVVVAVLSAQLVVLVAMVHAASACTLAEHSAPPCHARDDGRSPDETPACCQQPATTAATVESFRPDDGVAVICSFVADLSLTSATADLAARPALGFDPPFDDRPASDPRSHLLQTLLL